MVMRRKGRMGWNCRVEKSTKPQGKLKAGARAQTKPGEDS